MSELLGIVTRLGLAPLEWRNPSAAEDEDGHMFDAHHGGVALEFPMHLNMAGVRVSAEETLSTTTALIMFAKATGGEHWTSAHNLYGDPMTNGRIQFANFAKLDTAVVAARRWMAILWADAEAGGELATTPPPPVDWTGGNES